MWPYLLNSAIAILVFIPGALLLIALRMKYFSGYSILELLLAGVILWNYLLVVTSIIVGIFLNGSLNFYFQLFLYGSILISLVSLVFILKQAFRTSILTYISLNSKDIVAEFGNCTSLIIIFLYIFLLAILITIVNLYNPIMWNWDAIHLYLPVAKGIVATGGINYNPYFPATAEMSMAYPIAVPILYAWVINVVGNYFRFIPLLYLFIATLSVYSIGHLVSRSRVYSITTLAAFLSLPGILVITSMEGFYLDLPATAYASVTQYFTISGLLEKSRMKVVIAALSGSLCMLTKGVGIVLFPLSFAFMILGLQTRFNLGKKVLVVITAMSPWVFQYLYIVWNAFTRTSITANTSDPILLSYYALFKGVLLLLFFWLSFFVIKNVNATPFKILIREVFLFLIFAALGGLFFIRNILILKNITLEFPLTTVEVVKNPVLASIFFPPLNIETFLRDFQFYRLFMSGLVGAPFAVPIIAGIISFINKTFKHKDNVSALLLTWFLVLLLLWAFDFNNNFELWEFRRLIYFAPVLSIIIAEGTKTLLKFLKVDKKLLSSVFILSTTLSLVYIWHYKIPSNHLHVGVFVGKISVANVLDIISFVSFSTLTVFFALWVSKNCAYTFKIKTFRFIFKIKTFKKILIWKNSFMAIFLIIVMLMTIVSLRSIVTLALSEIVEKDPAYYDRIESAVHRDPRLASDYKDVIEYFRNNDFNQSVILTVGMLMLPYFANTTIIDLSDPFSYEYLSPLLQINNITQLINELNQRKIEYFLVPKPNLVNVEYYYRYKSLSDNYLFLQIIGNKVYFNLVREFNSYVLWHLIIREVPI